MIKHDANSYRADQHKFSNNFLSVNDRNLPEKVQLALKNKVVVTKGGRTEFFELLCLGVSYTILKPAYTEAVEALD